VVVISFSPDSKKLALASNDCVVHLLDTATGTAQQTHNRTGPVQAVAFSLDGKKVVSASGGTIQLWDTETGEVLRKFVQYVS
jgi:WD40 repeat protein